MRRFALLGAIAVGALVLVGTIGAAPTPKAIGNVWWLGGGSGNQPFHAIFTAQGGGSNDAKGTVEVWVYHQNGSFAKSYIGTVNCYSQSDGDTASFSGTVTSSVNTSATQFAMSVVDNGQGANATADKISAQLDPQLNGYTNDEATPCYEISASRDVYDGNLQVH